MTTWRAARRSTVCCAVILAMLGAAEAAAQSGPGAGQPALAVAPQPKLGEAFADVDPQASPSTGDAAQRSDIERAWFSGGDSLGSRANATRRRALELGANNAETAARALIAPASHQSGLGEALLAVKLAPDLPLAHAELARVHWRDGERAEAALRLASAVFAIPRNLEASLWLVSTILAIACLVVMAGSMAFLVLAGLSVFPRAAHDLGDLVSKRMPPFARTGLLGAVLVMPAVLGEGPAGLVLASFAVAMVYGTSRLRVAATLASVLLILSLFPIARFTGRALVTLDSDPVASAAHSVVRAMASGVELDLLHAVEHQDTLAAHALAVHARRAGRLDEAFDRYSALRERTPNDPVLMTNLANLHFRRGEVDQALELYESASARLDSPVLWFNLSQAYARSFRMEEFESALIRAQELGSSVVAEISALDETGLVADLSIPVARVRNRMLAASQGDAFAAWLRAPVVPGRLGAGWGLLALAFAGIGLASMVLSALFEHASTCQRCGRRICARCDGTVWNSVSCQNCHQLFNQTESTHAALRISRLGELRRRELKIERITQLGSLLIPGVSGLGAQRPDLAFMGIVFFGWALLAFMWRDGVVPDPLVVGFLGPIVLGVTAVLAGLAYVVVVVTGLALRRSQS